MPAKIARLATRPPFWIPEVSKAVRSSNPSCSKAEKSRRLMADRRIRGTLSRLKVHRGGSSATTRFRHSLHVGADSFHSLQSGKGNKTADWLAFGASRSLSCRPWDATSSQPLNGWVPNEGTSPRRPFLLKPNGRLFHTWRIASLNEGPI